MINVYIGYDPREHDAFIACRNSILWHTGSHNVNIRALKKQELIDAGIYTRDEYFPDEKVSTEFAFTRFLIPYLTDYYGWALFVDCDFVFTKPLQNLFNFKNDKYAVMCVQHDYIPKDSIKMDGQPQKAFPRKNWSSLMLFNCGHNDCGFLSPLRVASESAAWLHQMMWTKDDNIGSLAPEWNWLEGEYEKPAFVPAAIHWTLGGKWFPHKQDVDYGYLYDQYLSLSDKLVI